MRQKFNLPLQPSQVKEGVSCRLCVNECKIPEGERGLCGLRENFKGCLRGADSQKGSLEFYFDSLPTNCVASWVCPGCSEAGFPEFSYRLGPEYGYKNLAVFYNGCSFNCLFCQNYHFRETLTSLPQKFISPQQLVEVIDDKTSCICYFGRDPACQLPHSILTSKLALKNKKGRILRICWETNGFLSKNLLKEMVEISLVSGGCIKFDLKAYTESLHIALTGVSNRQIMENFKEVVRYIDKRRPPFY
ncbi:MAG: hypothetical protein DRP80_05400 [Candidatus Omnitrophota bacterium]|nr:MAG: hypothetical protein DRP69_02735 [Candidatus Omnitrophota bacterium]RKY43372.1 MAG: hypothetical protein DRP80_05400 [Candidatus Omnitrophota bacterium]